MMIINNGPNQSEPFEPWYNGVIDMVWLIGVDKSHRDNLLLCYVHKRTIQHLRSADDSHNNILHKYDIFSNNTLLS